jgi:Cohesin domain
MLASLRGVTYLLLGTLPGLGQALRVSSVSGAPGARIALHVSLDSPAGQAPAALQWEIAFPAQLLEVEDSGPEAGSAAKTSEKSLACRLREAYSYVCVLAGGRKPIANGPIATFRFRIRIGARAGTSTVKIDHVQAVTKDAKTLNIGGSEGQVSIH